MPVEINPQTGKPWGWHLEEDLTKVGQEIGSQITALTTSVVDCLAEIKRLRRELGDRNRTITELGLDRDRLYDAVYRAETIIRSYGNDDAANELLEMIGHE